MKSRILGALVWLPVFAAPLLAQPLIQPASLENGVSGVPYYVELYFDPPAAPGFYNFTVSSGSLPPSYSLSPHPNNPTRAILSGTTTVSNQEFSFTVTAQGPQTVPSRSYVLFIEPPLPVMTTTPLLPNATVGQFYDITLQATSGVPPYVWEVFPGFFLPPGLFLPGEQPGRLAGTPAAVGVFEFPIRLGDSLERFVGPIWLTLRVNPQGPPLEITTASPLPGATAGANYSVQFGATGGTTPYTWSLAQGTLPGGLTLSPTGALSGTPTASGAFAFVIRANDSTTFEDTKSFALTVAPAAAGLLTITTFSPLPPGTVGTPYSQTLSASGGVGSYAWSIAQGGLPPGIILSPSGGIAGTPSTSGTFGFVARVTDSAQNSVTKPLSLTINPPGTGPLTVLTGSPLPAGVVGTLYQQALQASGGATPYVWSIVQGTLPPGLSLSPSGLITGTPTAEGTAGFVVQVGDAVQATATRSFTLTITSTASLLTITSTSPLPPASLGEAYGFQFAATGGSPPYVWSAPEGLPTGFTLTPAGFLAVILQQGGQFEITVRVTDAVNTLVTRVFILPGPLPLTITNPSQLPAGAVNTPYTFDFASSGGQPPFVWTVAGGQTPPGLNLSESGRFSGTPQTQGSFAFTVQVRDSAQRTASQVFLISIGAAVPPIDFTSRNLSFTAFVNGDSPPAQTFDVVSASPAGFALALDGGLPGSAPPSWLIVTLRNGRTPATITVEARPQGLLAGTYSGRVLATGSSGQELRLVVTLTVRAEPPRLSAAPGFVRLTATPSGPRPERLLTLRNLGGGNPLALSVQLDPAVPWLTVTPAQGTIQPDVPATLRLQANAASLTPGGYRTEVVVTPGQGAAIRIPVQLIVRPPGPAIDLDTTGVFLESLSRVAATRRRVVRITNSGDQTLVWRTEITQTQTWLTLNPASGQIPPGGSAEVELAANPVSLAEGVHSALVRIIDPNAVNGPRYLVVVFRASAAPAAPLPELDPAGLVFTSAVGGSVPAAQRVRLFTLSPTPVAYQAAANPIDPGQWLELTAATGNVSALAPVDLTVRVNPAGLAPGVYQGRLSVRIGTGQIRSGLITLIIRPALAASEARTANGCTPSRLTLTPTSLPGNFASSVGWPVAIALRLFDDCGDPAAAGQVVASFNNGDAPLPLLLTNPGDGVFTGTWTPGRAASPTVMTATATAPGFPILQVDVAGAVATNEVPILARNGTLNNLNPRVGGSLAPGTVVQVFGSNLAANEVSPGILPLPRTFAGTTVLVGGVEAPFYFLSPGQLNVQLPVELEANREHAIVVAAGGGYTLPDTVVSAPVEPGLAVFGQNQVIAQRPDASIVLPETPARPGEVLVIYLVGMGAAAGNVGTGQPAPADPLPIAQTQPAVTIGGLPATLFYAGLTPGFAGLYQINLAVPATAPDGNLTVEVRQGNVAANSGILPVRR